LLLHSCPENAALDQEIDSCPVGPVPPGVNSFEFQSPAPDHKLIPEQDLLGVAALILTGSYAEQEFVRVGYYQNTEYEVARKSGKKVAVERLVRDITKKPRVTRFQIKWDVAPPQSTGALGAATSAAVPSADSYGDDDNEKDQMDVDTPTKSNGNIPIS
ncbi:ASF1 like histone chaperone-domain-containing protein, partial [Lentinula edodes]|uniref:ASF1 like histone chaperone-domain-containing protein n=1 Tax=Lentinula edodes TaxID=5353 RepID=UPI001E8DDDA8